MLGRYKRPCVAIFSSLGLGTHILEEPFHSVFGGVLAYLVRKQAIGIQASVGGFPIVSESGNWTTRRVQRPGGGRVW